MAAIICSSLVHMTSWNGLVWQQRLRCTFDLFKYINSSSAAPHGRVASGQASNSSLPERYVPKKSGVEKVAGREVERGLCETLRSQPYDSESGRSHVDRSLRDGGAKNVESASEIRSLPSTSFSKKCGGKLVGGDSVPVQDFEPRKQRKETLQKLPADEEFHSEGHYGPDARPRSLDFALKEDGRKGDVGTQELELAAKDYCISLLALAPQAEAKLRMKLSKKNYSSEVMDAVIADLQRCGLQSDEEYAEAFARSRWNGNSWGPKRIRFELLRRGLSEANVEAGLKHVFRNIEDAYDVDEEEQGATKWGMNQKAAKQLIFQARQRWSQGSEVDISKRKRRMAGWLQRRGFSWDITSDLLRIFESEDREKLN